MRSTILVLLAGLLGACSSESTQPLRLADFRFSEMEELEPWGIQPEANGGLHALLEGWEAPRAGVKALWTLGPGAGIRMRTVGSAATLRIRCSTSPQHVAQAQQLSLLWDGRPIAEIDFEAGWSMQESSVELPDSLYQDGWSILRLVPSETIDGRGVFVQSIELSANTTRSDRRRWASLSEAPAPSPAWQGRDFERNERPGPEFMPHILVLLLDTARADHFSGYGYERETTPFLDRIAAEGIRLDALFAEAPYTRNSVATLMSGLSWRDHQVLGVEDALSKEAVTLAEILRSAGYATRAVSDNVQASVASGIDQGFEEFSETWRERKNEWRPEVVLSAFERMRRGLPTDRPAFFYVHLLPPHEPYDPGAFDLWGPKDSSIVGSSQEIVEFDQGARPAAGPDHERLIARYDGGLRRADELARNIVESWQPTERPLWILALSDHGEAFGEHERFGHNTTVFDEMLRVPGVLWPSAAFEFLRGSEAELRGLSDVAPLLLHALGIQPGAGRWPARFAEVLQRPRAGRNQLFTMAVGRRFGVRSADGLLLRYRAKDRFELHAVQADWSQTQLLESWDRANEMRLQLRSFVENAEALEALRGELSEEQRRELEALGYL